MNDLATATLTTPGFLSLAAMQAAHADLLRCRRETGYTPECLAGITAFIERGRATGAVIDDDDDRWAAQSLLDYWANILYRANGQTAAAGLAEFDPESAEELPDSANPYRGLAAFGPNDGKFFFGRQRLVEELVAVLHQQRLLAVVGPSGSGKSSAVLAGLLPTLQAGALPDSQNWRYLRPMVPGSDPLVSLARLFQPAAAEAGWAEMQAASMRNNPDCAAGLAVLGGSQPVVLVVDQFEETFTLCEDATDRAAFIDNVVGLMNSSGPLHRVILTMRVDFESYLARVPEFQNLFEASQVRVTPLNAAELREAIEKPAQVVGLKFEDGVVDSLLKDVLGEPAALPLLQFTLARLWDGRERNRVTWETYRRLGGGRTALARSADAFYEALPYENQVTLKRIVLRLVRPGDGLEVTSNRVRRETLYQAGEARDRVDRVLDRLIEVGLVRRTLGDSPADEQVEVAHEALVRNWPRLVEWLDDERAAMRRRLRLTAAAEQWQEKGHDPAALLRGALLDDALRLEDLNDLETTYVEASQQAEEQAREARDAARERELSQARALADAQQRRAEIEMQFSERQGRLNQRLRRLLFIWMTQTLLFVATIIGYVLFGILPPTSTSYSSLGFREIVLLLSCLLFLVAVALGSVGLYAGLRYGILRTRGQARSSPLE